MSARNSIRFALVVLLGLTIAACQSEAPDDNASAEGVESETTEASDGESSQAREETQSRTAPMNLEEAISSARADLAKRSGAAPENVSIVQARAVTWPNGALGCPEEGMMYTQALVDGFYILLSDGESQHAYHAGRDGEPFYCPAERSQPPSASSDNNALS